MEPPPDSTWTEQPPPESVAGVRVLYADFNTPTHSVEDASIELRPDAISLDYRTAVTPGPEDIGVADTAYTRAWRVRATATDVYLARGGVADFEPETLLFSYAGAPIIELDCAFEQAGRVVVIASRATGALGAHELWLYWYDPFAAAFVFQSFGAGRTPRCILDEPHDTTNSDVLVFYIAGSVGASGTVCFRQQRDRYQTQYTTPVVGGGALDGTALPAISDLYIEDVVKARDGRVVVLFSVREAGRYRFAHLVSTLYPVAAGQEGLTLPNAGVADGSLLFGSFVVGPGGIEPVQTQWIDVDGLDFNSNPAVVAGVLAASLILHTTYDIEGLNVPANASVQAGSLLSIMILYIAYDIENLQVAVNPTVEAGSLLVIVIVYTTYDIEGLNMAANPSVVAGSLAA